MCCCFLTQIRRVGRDSSVSLRSNRNDKEEICEENIKKEFAREKD